MISDVSQEEQAGLNLVALNGADQVLPNMDEDDALMQNATTMWGDLVLHQWDSLINQFAVENCSVVGSSSAHSYMGEGFRALARMLAQKQIPMELADGTKLIGHFQTYAPCNHPPLLSGTRWALDAREPPSQSIDDYVLTEYRRVAWTIACILRDGSAEAPLRESLLALTRAMVFFDDPNEKRELQDMYALENPKAAISDEETQARWVRFLDGLRMKKSNPEKQMVRWCQNKYVDLGFCSAALKLCYDGSPQIRVQAHLLGIALLQNGNARAQAVYMEELKDPEHSSNFFQSCHLACTDAGVITEKWMATISEIDPLHALSGFSFSMGASTTAMGQPSQKATEIAAVHDAAAKRKPQLQEAYAQSTELVLASVKLLELLGRGHNLEVQNWIRQQGSSMSSVNMLAVAQYLFERLTADLHKGIVCWEWMLLSLLVQLARFFTEMMQGPCRQNQAFLASSNLVVLIMKCVKTLHVDLNADADKEFEEVAAALHPLVSDLPPGSQRLVIWTRCEIKTTLLEVVAAMLECCDVSTQIPAQVASQVDHRILLEELADVMAEHEVYELGRMSRRPAPAVRYGLLNHVRKFWPGSQEDRLVTMEHLEQLGLAVYIVLVTLGPTDLDLELDRDMCPLIATLVHQEHTFECQLEQKTKVAGHRHCVCLSAVGKDLSRISKSVEVNYRDTVFKHWFRVPEEALSQRSDPDFEAHSLHAMQKVRVSGETPDEKARRLLRCWQLLSEEIKVAGALARSAGMLYAFRNYFDSAQIFISLLIVAICIFSYGSASDPWSSNQYHEENVVQVLCVLHIILMAGTAWKYVVDKALDITAEMQMELKEGSKYLKIAESTRFSSLIYSTILINTMFTVLELEMDIDPQSDIAAVFLLFEICFTIVYSFEALIKIKAYTWPGYWSDSWNKMDFVLLMMCVTFLIAIDIFSFGLPIPLSIIRAVRALRLLRTLRFIKKFVESYNELQQLNKNAEDDWSDDFVMDDPMKEGWQETLPRPPSMVDDGQFVDYAFRFALDRWTYYIVFLQALSIIGIFIPLTHFIQLIDFYRLPLARLSMVAVRKRWKHILCTVAVLLMTLFIINGVDFVWVLGGAREPFALDWVTYEEISDGTLYEHFWRGLVHGAHGNLLHVGVQLQELDSQAPNSIKEHFGSQIQTLLGVLWVMLYGFAFMGIVGGQITDGYIETRDDIQKIRNDESERCIVCSLQRAVIEEACGGFKRHTSMDHDPWSYLFFLHYLSFKDTDRYTGLESYVANKLDNSGDISFIPLNQCAALQRKAQRDEWTDILDEMNTFNLDVASQVTLDIHQ